MMIAQQQPYGSKSQYGGCPPHSSAVCGVGGPHRHSHWQVTNSGSYCEQLNADGTAQSCGPVGAVGSHRQPHGGTSHTSQWNCAGDAQSWGSSGASGSQMQWFVIPSDSHLNCCGAAQSDGSSGGPPPVELAAPVVTAPVLVPPADVGSTVVAAEPVVVVVAPGPVDGSPLPAPSVPPVPPSVSPSGRDAQPPSAAPITTSA